LKLAADASLQLAGAAGRAGRPVSPSTVVRAARVAFYGAVAVTIDKRFVLEAEHRRGGMGVVWRAKDLRTRTPVAIKILHDRSAAEQAQRFVREATLLAQLAHGSIVSYIAHGKTVDGAPYLAMEWLEGEDASERLARQPLTPKESLQLIRAATRALSVAHERGVIHRDLKPSNLFLRNRQVDDVVLLDLGLARLMSSAEGLTRTGAILGTPSYMAPEQARGQGDIGPAADVYSLGCVLFECLAGEPPFVGTHVISVMAKLLFEQTPRVRDRRPNVPVDVDDLVAAMLCKDRAGRPADAAALARALARLHDAAPTLAVPSPSPEPPSGIEPELVSVILATGSGADAALELTPQDLTAFGGELQRLSDGTTVVTLTQRREAMTDLAVRAARCALRLRDIAPGAGIVLATGRAIPLERVHVGEAVDRASILLGARGARRDDVIWLDEMTAGLLDARFRTTPVGPGIFALAGEEPTVDPSRPLLGLPTACIGREHELATLELLLRTCVDEASPRAILITALPGMGKTRLRQELTRRLHASGSELLVLVGQGDSTRTSSRFGLLGSALGRLCGLRPDRAPEENRARLLARVGERLPAADRLRTAAFLGELCGVSFAPGVLPELDSAQRVPQQMSRLIELAWLTFLRAEAAANPVLIALDDLQWSDALTIALVGAALRDLSASPVMVLALARPEVVEVFPDLWGQRLARLPLRPLTAPAMTRLVRQVLRDGISDDDARRIVSRADGNALYLEELIRAAAAGHEAVPETVVAMLQARIKLLTPVLRQVLRGASVFGVGFPVAGVEALVRTTLTADEVTRSLATLVEHEILEPSSGDREQWRFRHGLMRDAAYGLLMSEDRARAHVLAARYLCDAGDDPAVIAAHFELGGSTADAVRHYVEATELAYRRADHGAIRSLAGRAIAAGAAGIERGLLRSMEAPTLLFLHDYAGSWAAIEESLALLPPRHRRRTQSLGTATLCGVQMGRADAVTPFVDELYATEPEERDRADYTIAVGYACLSSILVAHRRMSTRLLARINHIDGQLGGEELIARGSVLFCRALFLQFLGDSPYEAWTFAQHSVAQQRAINNRRLLSNSLVLMGEAARWLFSPEEGLQTMREGVTIARATGEAVGMDYLSQFLAMLIAEHGPAASLEEARELASLPARREESGDLYRGLALSARALVDLREGALARAADAARDGRELLRALGQRAFWPHTDRILLEALIRTGDPAAGAIADEALATLATHGPMGHLELPLRQTAARAHLAVGRRDDGVRGLTSALAGLRARAAKIPVAAMRERFLTAVPEHAALCALARELGIPTDDSPAQGAGPAGASG
jgi:hypothetical protein